MTQVKRQGGFSHTIVILARLSMVIFKLSPLTLLKTQRVVFSPLIKMGQ